MIGMSSMAKECMKINAIKQKWTHNKIIKSGEILKEILTTYVPIQILSGYERQ